MDNRTRYIALAEHIWFLGMTEKQLQQVATYKPGRTFADVIAAREEGLRRGRYFEGQAITVAEELAKVIEIPETSEQTYQQLLKTLQHRNSL